MTEPTVLHVVILRPAILPAPVDAAQLMRIADANLSTFGVGTIPPPQPLLAPMMSCPAPSTWSH